jgi:hypothetical protein
LFGSLDFELGLCRQPRAYGSLAIFRQFQLISLLFPFWRWPEMIQSDLRDMPPAGTRRIAATRQPAHFNFEIVLGE